MVVVVCGVFYQIDEEDLDLPPMPTEAELYGGHCHLVLPLHASTKQSKLKAGTHVVLPMSEVPNSTVHHVDGTQPMVDLVRSVRLRLNGGYGMLVFAMWWWWW